jgi:hypothetical protein
MENGSHEVLIQQNGLYANLHRIQFSNVWSSWLAQHNIVLLLFEAAFCLKRNRLANEIA